MTGELAYTLALTGTSLFYLGKVNTDGQIHDGLGVVPIDGGAAKLVSTYADSATSLAAEDSTSYFASGSIVIRDTVGGAMMETVYTSMGYDVEQVALDSTSYYVTLSNGMTSEGAILRGPKAGGPASIIVTLPSSSPHPRALRVDGKNLYFVTVDGAASNPVATLWKAPVAGGDPVELVHGVNYTAEIAIDDTSVYYFTPADKPASLMKIARDGGTPVELLAGLRFPHALAVNSDAIYATEINPPADDYHSDGESKVHKVPKNGGCTTVIATQQTLTSSTYQALVANETSVYWGTPNGIRKVPR